MNFGIVSGIATAVMFVCFIGIVAWAYSSRRRKDFDEAAHLPLADEGDKP
jgi:cytochrome c oxidase cbb3-type subunit 4